MSSILIIDGLAGLGEPGHLADQALADGPCLVTMLTGVASRLCSWPRRAVGGGCTERPRRAAGAGGGASVVGMTPLALDRGGRLKITLATHAVPLGLDQPQAAAFALQRTPTG